MGYLGEFMLLLRKTPSVNELIDFMENSGFENYINFTNVSNNPHIPMRMLKGSLIQGYLLLVK